MRKFLFVAMMLCCVLVSNAQNFRFGATGGMNLNAVTGEKNRVGYTVGLQSEYFFTDYHGWYLGVGLQLANRNWKSNVYYDANSQQTSEWKANPHFLELPVHVGYMLSVSKNFSVFLNAGPYVGVGLFGKQKVTINGKESTVNNNVFNDYLKRFDYGVGANVGVQVCKHVQISVGYQWGLNNLKGKDNSMDYKNRSLEVKLGYMF